MLCEILAWSEPNQVPDGAGHSGNIYSGSDFINMSRMGGGVINCCNECNPWYGGYDAGCMGTAGTFQFDLGSTKNVLSIFIGGP